MSTRYSTYSPGSFSGRTIEPNTTPQEPFQWNLRRSVFARALSVEGSEFDGLGPTIRRPLNVHQPVQPHVAFQLGNSKARVTARDVMRECAATLRPEDSIERAARLLSRTESGSIPVVDSGHRLIGIITDRDITVKLVALGASIPHAQVSDCMTGEAFACSAESSLEGCVSAMAWHQLTCMPIVDDEQKVLGTISRSDLASYVFEHPQRVEQDAMADILWALAS